MRRAAMGRRRYPLVGASRRSEVIDERTNFKRSTRDAYLVRLKARRLIETVGRGDVKASDELFG